MPMSICETDYVGEGYDTYETVCYDDNGDEYLRCYFRSNGSLLLCRAL